jgi:PAS domain S-box-containing protein
VHFFIKDGGGMELLESYKVSNFLKDGIEPLSVNSEIQEALNFMVANNYNNIPVVNKDRLLVGYIPKNKIIQFFEEKKKNIRLCEVMENVNNDILVDENDNINKILNKLDSIIVIDKEGRFKGILDKAKLINKLIEEFSSEINSLKEYDSILNTILETVYDGILVVDSEGYIKLISKAYCKFLGVKEEEVIGKHVTEVVENTRMHIVAKTGVPEIADIQKIKNNYMIATRIPIFKDGKVIGVVGKVLFRNIAELEELHNKIRMFEDEIKKYKAEFKNLNQAKYSFEDIIGSSEKLLEAKKIAMKAAVTDSNILLIAESGTGKELFAHAIHKNSRRRYGPFVKVNCAAIPQELLESELFGYEEGAFTGAKKGGKVGKFELADNGTIFLDEIGDMPLEMQAKLLRVIQEKEIEKIGSVAPKKIDVRIIAATNKNLEELVSQGKFREDLYYRLNVITISIPPLRERKKDIVEIAHYYLNYFSTKYNKNIESFTKEAIRALVNYSWPGNIRELINVIERAVNIIDNEKLINIEHLPSKIVGDRKVIALKPLEELLWETERIAIIEALKITGGNKSEAAKILKISRSTFYEKLQKYNLLS